MASRYRTKANPLRPFPREKRDIDFLGIDALRNLYARNQNILNTRTQGSSTYVNRLEAEQARIEARIAELETMNNIQGRMRRATVTDNDPTVELLQKEMQQTTLGNTPAPASDERWVSSTVLAKRQAVAAWGKRTQTQSGFRTGFLSVEEAIDIEQRANSMQREREMRAEEKRQKSMMPSRSTSNGSKLSKSEYEQRIWSFMNYKPTDSDFEGEDDDDDDDDDDDNDPGAWLREEEEHGTFGGKNEQQLELPDAEDIAHIIRMDESKFHYNTFYQPKDNY